jgi:hypothetical protein
MGALSSGVKKQGRGIDNSPPCTSTSTLVFMVLYLSNVAQEKDVGGWIILVWIL